MQVFLSNIPLFLFFLSIYFLQENILILLFYVGGFIANELLNRVLKPIMKDPRPRPLSPTDKYGMLSSHSQLAAFSLVFMTLVLQEKYYVYAWQIILLFSVLTLVSMAQRIATKAHSLKQVIVGGLLGGVLGYIFYSLFNVVNKNISKKGIL